MKRLVPTLLAAVAAATLVLSATLASAAEIRDFEPASFEAAQQAGGPIIIDITATWCPTCAAQKPIISALANEPAYKNLTIFHVDFDSQTDVVRNFGAQMQSTLIAYHGKAETSRSVGDTDPGSLKALFASTLGQ